MKIGMELLSDAIPGSGEGKAGIVDMDIAHDEYGLPLIPAKRIKGILRESSKELEDSGIFDLSHTENIFGKSGAQTGTDFKISDGYPENYFEFRKLLEFCKTNNNLASVFNREAVLSFFTYIRSQTTMENGVAKEDTLRSFRVLKKGLSFEFDVECPDKWKSHIEKICKVTRKFGISRTRGMGEISLKFFDDSCRKDGEMPTSPDNFNDEDLCRLTLNIHNIGQLIVTNQVGKDQITEKYIPGSFILGALANAYIKNFRLKFKNAHNDEKFRNIFLNNGIMFSNAYPACKEDEDPYYPAPASIVREKEKENYFDIADASQFEQIIDEKIHIKKIRNEFVRINPMEMQSMTIPTEVAYHHQRPEDRSMGHAGEKDGQFFQLTVLKPHQFFIGYIDGKYKYIKLLLNIIKKNKIFYLGKSKTAQYGKCIFEEKPEITSHTGENVKEWFNNENIVVTLESDVILRNEYGFPAPDPEILKNEIAEILKTDADTISIVQSFLKFRQPGGYSGVWNMPKIQAPSLAAGSVIVFKNNGNDFEDISCLENHCFGIRTNEGFGKIKINWHGKDEIVFSDETIELPGPDNFGSSMALIRYVLCRRLEDALHNEAVKCADRPLPLSNSFIGNMIMLIKGSENFEKLNKNFSKLKKPAKKQLEKITGIIFLKEEKFELDMVKFENKIKELRDSAHNTDLRDQILINAGMNEEFYENDIFMLYKTYSIHFLTLLRLQNRKAGKNG